MICNTALISAITFAVRPCKVEARTFRTPVIFFFAAAVFYALNAYISRYFTRLSGIALLLLFAAYIAYTIWSGKRHGFGAEDPSEDDRDNPLWKTMLMLVAGAVSIAIGARLLVDNGTLIAQALGVPDSVIGLTMVALGTSLPELITAITSLVKGHSALSLGNVIGANVFNIVLVSGTAITISPFSIPAEKLLGGMNASLMVDLPVMLAVMALLCVPAVKSGRLQRWQGIALLCIYAAFTAFQFLI